MGQLAQQNARSSDIKSSGQALVTDHTAANGKATAVANQIGVTPPIDLSVSGAAISADTVPDAGTVLAVSRGIGRVVRHFVGGFAIQFIERQNRETVKGLVIRE